MLPQSFIDKVKSATDIVELVSTYVELKKVGNDVWQGICPNPKHKDSNPSFTVWGKEQSWCCYGCHNGEKSLKHKYKNYGSDCFAFVQWISNGKKNWKQAIIELAENAGIPLPDDKNAHIYDMNNKLSLSYRHGLHGKPFNYLLKRGLSRKDMEKWLIGFDGKKLIFPLFDKYKNILGFNKRWLEVPEDKNDKYRNSPNSKIFNKSFYLYGINNLDHDFPEIRITEGCLDVILAEKYGAKNMVSTLGTSFTEGHVEIIKSYNKTPVFCMDGDEAGLISINKSIDLLSKEGIYSKILILPSKKDMADMANDLKYDIEEYISSNSMTYGYYKIHNIINQYDSKTNELKMKLLPDIINILDNISNKDEKFIIKEFVKDRLHIDI